MLRKLFKYEIKESSRLLIPLVLSVIILTLINKIFISINNNFVIFQLTKAIFIFMLVVSYMAFLGATMIIIIQRFYKNLLGDEGYLMFTLPVKVSDHIIIKTLVSTLWIAISIIIVCISMVFITAKFNLLSELITNFSESDMKLTLIFILFEIIGLSIVSIINNILQIYVSIALGHQFNKHKIIASFVVYIGIYVFLQIIATIFLVIIAFLGNWFSMNIDLKLEDNATIIHLFMIGSIAIITIISAIYYGVTRWILANRLNLE